MPDERQHDLALNRFWNELIDAGDDVAPTDIESARAETLVRLHTMTRTPPPRATRSRLDDEMQVLFAAPRNGREPLDLSQVHIFTYRAGDELNVWTSPSHGERLAPSPVAARFRWAAAHLATALLVLLALGVGFLAIGPGTLNGERLNGLRSVFAPETPESGVTIEETLLAVTLPAEALPHGSRVSGNLSHFTIDPGIESSWEPSLGGCCPGLRLDYVVEGELSVRPSGQARVMRAGTSLSPEVIAAGTDVVLRPGDTLMARYEDPFESTNDGSAMVRLLDWVFVDGFVTSNHGNPSGWDYHFDGQYVFDLTMPEQPATLRLERVALEPGAFLSVSPGALAQFGITLADDEPLDLVTQDAMANNNDSPITVHVLTVITEAPGSDEPASLSTDGMLETVSAPALPVKMLSVVGNLDPLL